MYGHSDYDLWKLDEGIYEKIACDGCGEMFDQDELEEFEHDNLMLCYNCASDMVPRANCYGCDERCDVEDMYTLDGKKYCKYCKEHEYDER